MWQSATGSHSVKELSLQLHFWEAEIYIYKSSPQRNITVILPTAFIHNYHFYLHLHFPFCRLFMLGVGTLQHATLERRHYWDHRAAKGNDTPLLFSRSLLEALIQQRAPHGPKQLHLPTFLRQPFLNSNTPAPFLCQYKFTCINLWCYRHVNLFKKKILQMIKKKQAKKPSVPHVSPKLSEISLVRYIKASAGQ